MRVYAGIDPLTKKELYLRETVPAGPGAAREAEQVRTRLLGLVHRGRPEVTPCLIVSAIWNMTVAIEHEHLDFIRNQDAAARFERGGR